MEIVAVCITTLASGVYAMVLLSMVLYTHLNLHRPEVWSASVRDWQWFGRLTPAGDVDVDHTTKYPRGAKRLFSGQSRGPGIKDGFYKPFNRFLSNHTIFRRVTGVEPIWLVLARGTVGLAFLVGLFAYGMIQCIQLPIIEDGSTLPVRPLQRSLNDDIPSVTSLESVTVVFAAYTTAWNPNMVPVPPLVEALYVNGTSRLCAVNQTAFLTWNWNCSRLGGLPDTTIIATFVNCPG
ncbi:hypothetical protein FRB95_013331 [Tulasnella sp. JGI-2019a]|nr:hypothetical protein FRB93_010804 [Tulasnella sp. JGI-2019a]KAG9023281.1 hypothetical protein FRB95_013331 [Tulasnella sp. JGI-2019a]